ncbi:MAG: hypothetical protein OHK0046_30730 [Anaerolineae bacterium]
MMQRLTAQIPPYMRPNHPVLRYALGTRRQFSAGERFARAFLTILALLVFLLAGYLIASNLLRENPFERPLTQMLSQVLFWPTVAVQVALQITVLFMTVNTIGEEKRRQTWDSLKTTTTGAALALRTRWSAVLFYRLRGLLSLIMMVRVVLIVGILIDLTAFRGEYLNYLTGSITPPIPLAVGVLLLALTMTAVVLLPITALGFDAAFGLLVSTFVQQRTYIALTQVVLTAVRVTVVIGLMVAMTQFRTGVFPGEDWVVWLLLLLFAALGDWGLSFLWLGFFAAEVWANVPYSVFLGVALLTFVLVQAALTDMVLALAIRRAERADKS